MRRGKRLRATYQAEKGYVSLIRRCCELPSLFWRVLFGKSKWQKKKIMSFQIPHPFYKDYFELNNAFLRFGTLSKILCDLENRYI